MFVIVPEHYAAKRPIRSSVIYDLNETMEIQYDRLTTHDRCSKNPFRAFDFDELFSRSHAQNVGRY